MSDEYGFLDEAAGPVRFLAAYLEVLKDEDPEMHEKICSKQREIMSGIEPNSRRGPTILELIKDVLKQADEKRYYQIKSQQSTKGLN